MHTTGDLRKASPIPKVSTPTRRRVCGQNLQYRTTEPFIFKFRTTSNSAMTSSSPLELDVAGFPVLVDPEGNLEYSSSAQHDIA